jgi:hypothetical protein
MLCGYQAGSKGEAVADLEKEKEAQVPDRTHVTMLTCTSSHLAEGCAASGTRSNTSITSDQTRWRWVRSTLTYGDVGFTGVRREEERRPDAWARQVVFDMTRHVTVFTLTNVLKRLDVDGAASGRFIQWVRLWIECSGDRLVTVNNQRATFKLRTRDAGFHDWMLA